MGKGVRRARLRAIDSAKERTEFAITGLFQRVASRASALIKDFSLPNQFGGKSGRLGGTQREQRHDKAKPF